jgi:hypothetical protein
VGEKAFGELQDSVKRLTSEARQNANSVDYLEGLVFGYGSHYKQAGSSTSSLPPAKIGDIDVDEKFDFSSDGEPALVRYGL